MFVNKLLAVLALLLVLTACETTPSRQLATSSETEQPQIVDSLSKEIVDYVYNSYHVYPPGLGLSVRYNNLYQENHYADVYVWPVPNEMVDQSHEELIKIFAEGAISAVFSYEKQGAYSQVKVVSSQSYRHGGLTISEHQLSYFNGEADVLSYLFMSESNGELLKARVSLDNTARNKERTEVREFVNRIFSEIVKQQSGAIIIGAKE